MTPFLNTLSQHSTSFFAFLLLFLRSHRRDNAPRVGHIVYAMYQLHCKVRHLYTTPLTFPPPL